MKNFQIFFKDGRVRQMTADRINVTKSEVMVYRGDEVIQSFERFSVIMMDETAVEAEPSPDLPKSLQPL